MAVTFKNRKKSIVPVYVWPVKSMCRENGGCGWTSMWTEADKILLRITTRCCSCGGQMVDVEQ